MRTRWAGYLEPEGQGDTASSTATALGSTQDQFGPFWGQAKCGSPGQLHSQPLVLPGGCFALPAASMPSAAGPVLALQGQAVQFSWPFLIPGAVMRSELCSSIS